MYDRTKETGNRMLTYLLPIKGTQLPADAAEDLASVDKVIKSTFKSMKSIKNIYHNLQDLRANPHPAMQELYTQLLDDSIEFHRHVAAIIDRDYEVENFEELTTTYNEMKDFHK